MERLFRYANEDVLNPEELLFRSLVKPLEKDLSKLQPEVTKACVKILTTLSDQEDGIETLLEYKDNLIFDLLIKNFNELKDTKNINHFEDVLDMLHIIVQGQENVEQTYLKMVPPLVMIVSDQNNWSFAIQLECAKLLNLLIEKSQDLPGCVRNSKEVKLFIEQFGSIVSEAGDYELQAAIMEALFRIVTTEEKESFCSKWFSSEKLRNSFMAIRNEEYEADCRSFLNFMNTHDAEQQRVISFPVLCIALGRYQLRRPKDHRLTEFWLDFNLRSQSISTFVNDDSCNEEDSEWEMISLRKEMVRDFRLNVTDEKTILVLKLFEPASSLAPFCPVAPEHYVKINFESKYDVSHAVERLFGQVKYVQLPVASPSTSSPAGGSHSNRVSLAISPLAVHSTTFPIAKQTAKVEYVKDKLISDGTVSSSSGPEIYQYSEKQKSVTSAANLPCESLCESSTQAHTNDNPDRPDVVDDDQRVSQPTIIPESQDAINDNKKQSCNLKEKLKSRDNDKPNQDPVAVELAKKNCLGNQVHSTAPNTVSQEKITDKENSKLQSKKGKKLLTTHVGMFQDSPDENYVAPPVKPPSKEQQRKARAQARKRQKQGNRMKKIEITEEAMAAFDFVEETIETKAMSERGMDDVKGMNSSVKKKAKPPNGSKKRGKEAGKIHPNKPDTESSSTARRSSRRRRNKIDYKELTSEHDQMSDGEEEVEHSSLKKSGDERKQNKSVSFVSPVGETSYYEVQSDYSLTPEEKAKNVLESKMLELPCTSQNIGRLVEECDKNNGSMNCQKLEMAERCATEVLMKDGNHSQKRLTRVDDDVDFTVCPKKKLKTNEEKKVKHKIKPYERNLQFGWGGTKMEICEDKDGNVFDFPDSDGECSVVDTKRNSYCHDPVETPWSAQREKKHRVKKDYKLENIKVVKKSKKTVKEIKDEDYLQQEMVSPQTVSHEEIDCDVNNNRAKSKSKKKANKPVQRKPKKNGSKQAVQNEFNDSPKKHLSNYDEIMQFELQVEVVESKKPQSDEKVRVVPNCSASKKRNVSKNTPVIEGMSDVSDADGSQNISLVMKKQEKISSGSSSSSQSSIEQNKFRETNKMVTRKQQKKSSPDNNECYEESNESSLMSSVELSQQEFFNETPMSETFSSKLNTSKKWVHNLNKVFENIEANEAKKTKKAWKSPVVIMREDFIDNNKTTTTPSWKAIGASSSSLTSLLNTPKIYPEPNLVSVTPGSPALQEDEAVSGFASFCQNLLNQFSKSKETENEDGSQDCCEEGDKDFESSPSVTLSPVKKKKKKCQPEKKIQKVSTGGVSTKIDEIGLEWEKKLKNIIDQSTTPDGIDAASLEVCSSQKEIMKKSSTVVKDDSDSDDFEVGTPPIQMVDIPKIDKIVDDDALCGEIQSVLKSFGASMNKTLNTKCHAIENFLQKVSKLLNKRMHAVWRDQQKLRQDFDKLFNEKCDEALSVWDSTVQTKENRTMKVLQQLQMMLKENYEDEQNRIKRLRAMHHKYFEDRIKLSDQEQALQAKAQEQVHQDLRHFRKQLIFENKSHGVNHIRRSLQAMLNNV